MKRAAIAAVACLWAANAYAVPGDSSNPMWSFTVDPSTNPPTVLGTVAHPLNVTGGGTVFQATVFPTIFSANTATVTQVIAPSGTLTTYLVNWAFQVDPSAAGNGTFQIVAGQGSNCATSQRPMTAVWSFAPGQGIQRGTIGVLNSSDPGDAFCVKTTTANLVNFDIGAAQQ